ncbi:MAG: HAMP domain-containing histidine kinase [Proteobacteria bacterium]|nr:HAMP domain-containing histidine kinase [Pseudomonadota bacterium]
MNERRPRLNARLLRAFLLQIALISATAVAGVYLAEFAIREMLIVSALEREADYFWSRYSITADTPAPNTNTLIGYLFTTNAAEIPAEFSSLKLGIHDLKTAVGDSVVHVSEVDGKRLYLVFDANNIQQLATWFGVAPLALMLVVLYSSAWVAYGLARKAVSPVVRLARLVRDINVETPDRAAFDTTQLAHGADTEIETLSHALSHLMGRVDQLIERERNFTREASHELRSPLTVILMASDNLLGRPLDDSARAMVEKIRGAAQDMVELTEALLLLAREHEGQLATEVVSVNQVLRQELARCRMIFEAKHLEFRFDESVDLELDAAPRLLAIVLGNLLRNACAYTDAGVIIIAVDAHRVTIRDSGIGMSKENLGRLFTPYFRVSQARGSGHGIGLTLVKRISDRFGWRLDIASEPERGTMVEVGLLAARVVKASSSRTASA